MVKTVVNIKQFNKGLAISAVLFISIHYLWVSVMLYYSEEWPIVKIHVINLSYRNTFNFFLNFKII